MLLVKDKVYSRLYNSLYQCTQRGLDPHSHSLSSSSFISTLSIVLFVGKLQRKSKLFLSNVILSQSNLSLISHIGSMSLILKIDKAHPGAACNIGMGGGDCGDPRPPRATYNPSHGFSKRHVSIRLTRQDWGAGCLEPHGPHVFTMLVHFRQTGLQFLLTHVAYRV